jgi:ribosomal protein S18 acetylase RimI-like enzyme
MEFVFITVDDPRYQQALELRFGVLREPLGHARADVQFPFENESLHLIAYGEAVVCGCVMFHPESSSRGRLLQMAVAAQLQGRGLGRMLVRRLEGELERRGFDEVTLHARAPVVRFYERLGYAVYDEPFCEVGIEHRHMRRRLAALA